MDPSSPLQPYVPPAQPAAPQPPSTAVSDSASSFSTPQPYAPLSPPAPTTEGPQGSAKQDLIEQLKKANNVLVTVNSNPSVDQLSAAIGLTIILNKLGKHATAVYSGATPSTIEFLQPEKTLEKNTDSLRDFIIALDKAKADKLRYKVEDKFVKIFITPYHTSLSENDLEFSQGDFNVDVIVALGVHQREELDQSIIAHGRILHDAVTVSVNNKKTAELGALNWFQADASSLCEMVVGLIEPLQGDKTLLDSQTATAFLTGVVAETERFSNVKTTPHTMNISAILMKAGANQQLIASKLEVPKPEVQEKTFDDKKMDELAKEPDTTSPVPAPVPTPSVDGSLEIKHKETPAPAPTKTLKDLEKENHSEPEEIEDDLAKIHIDEEGKLLPVDKTPPKPAQPDVPPATSPSSNMILTPPIINGDMSASTQPQDDSTAPLDPMAQASLSEHIKTVSPLTEEEKDKTLEQIEESVSSTHVAPNTDAAVSTEPQSTPNEDVARDAVEQAANAAEPSRFEPEEALNSQPIDLDSAETETAESVNSSGDMTNEEVFPPQLVGPDTGPAPDPTAGAEDPSAPPLVPPPLMPPNS
ncbi:MAG: hypothetical protein QG628_621 [Patescibacteria group bacterium]|jgi:hypothetical protein|nr:hypothetical protein [Patescibacteria group bacterium]